VRDARSAADHAQPRSPFCRRFAGAAIFVTLIFFATATPLPAILIFDIFADIDIAAAPSCSIRHFSLAAFRFRRLMPDATAAERIDAADFDTRYSCFTARLRQLFFIARCHAA
jgi:hypothetical protein